MILQVGLTRDQIIDQNINKNEKNFALQIQWALL